MRFFPRGRGPLVSVLLPTRGRPEHLGAAVDSLVSLARDPGQLEFWLRIDDDDNPTQDIVRRMSPDFQGLMHWVSGPRGNGYLDIHHWLNDLASRSQGDWLLVWSDDALMQTQDWDRVLEWTAVMCWHPCPEDVMMLVPQVNDLPHTNEFFFLRHKTYEILGHVCQSCYGDAWLVGVMEAVNSMVRLPSVKVAHPRTMKEYGTRGLPETYWEGFGSLWSVPAVAAKLGDSSRLLGHIARQDAFPWHPGPTAGPGWYYWKWRQDGQPQHIMLKPDGMCRAFPSDGVVREDRTPTELGGLWRPRGER